MIPQRDFRLTEVIILLHNCGYRFGSVILPYDVASWIHVNCLWPLLLTWFNFNPSMDK